MNGLPLHHVGIAVRSLGAAAATLTRLTGSQPTPAETVPGQGVRVQFLGPVELLEPLGPDTTVGRFLERRGEGLHHIAYTVVDIRSELVRLAAEGFQLIDTEPRPGAHGHRVAFLHPKDTGGVLIELVED